MEIWTIVDCKLILGQFLLSYSVDSIQKILLSKARSYLIVQRLYSINSRQLIDFSKFYLADTHRGGDRFTLRKNGAYSSVAFLGKVN